MASSARISELREVVGIEMDPNMESFTKTSEPWGGPRSRVC